jgi:hypothetical protein
MATANKQSSARSATAAVAALAAVNWGFDLKDRKDPRTVVDGITHKSAAIRALSAAGFTAGEIVRLSDPKKAGENALKVLQYTSADAPQIAVRYQHVRNVLKQPLKKSETPAQSAAG